MNRRKWTAGAIAVRWHYDGHALTFKVAHVPDRLARLIYTAHPWNRIR